MNKIYPIDDLSEEQLSQLAARLEQGAVMAFATDTVYGLGANAFDEKAISRIYEIKQRPAGAALQLLVGTVEQAKQLVQWNEYAERLAKSYWPGGLTLILPPSEKGRPLLRGFAGLGLRVPHQPGLVRLLAKMSVPLASTSANVHGHPVITTEQELIAFASGKVDFMLIGGTLSAQASSVVEMMQPPFRLLREGSISKKSLEDTAQTSLK